jgi:hypothetical protein
MEGALHPSLAIFAATAPELLQLLTAPLTPSPLEFLPSRH